jgi:hypothetical protein
MVNSNFIHYAENELNGLLAVVFDVPFATPPITIIDLTIDLAYARRMLTLNPDESKIVRDAVYGRINNLVMGKEVLITSSGTVISALELTGDRTIWSSTMNYPPVNTMLDADNAHTMISSEMLYQEEDLR